MHFKEHSKAGEISKLGKWAIWLISYFFSLPLLAQTGSSQVSLPASNKSQAHAAISYQQTSYLTKLPGKAELNSSDHTFIDALADYHSENFRFAGQGRFGYTTESQNSYLVMEEAFIATQRKASNLIIGRRFVNWNQMDKQWKLGQWEPVYNIDPLKPVYQGLTGVFVQYQQEQLQATFFASNIYNPSLTPEIKENGDGDLIATSRWAQDPSAEFPLQGKSTQIFYNLEVPELESLVLRPSVAGNLTLGDQQDGFWINSSIANKPINDLTIAYKGILKVEGDGTFGDVTIVPKVLRHDVVATELGRSFEGGKIVFSYSKDRPYNEQPEKGWNSQQLEPLEAINAHVQMDLYSLGDEVAYFGIAKLQVNGGASSDMDSDGNKSSDRFAPRTTFKDALAFEFYGPLYRGKKQRVVSEFRYVHDFEQRGSLLNAEVRYSPNGRWGLVLGGDLLGVNDDSVENESGGFLNLYRANDRIYTGASYVF